ncbi:carbohydrate kinase family protein [Georgenia subflava]|uniref:Carbohydrate kinase n=1 Tax=Georgenia subflava TaxID=1622177 RepID=A0A6N7ESG1_9MICO|nr:carbohydrate kinase [Georgenia subflava]MPV39046.1 carbohydrate kinase [Georgenia subflava]
MSTRDAARGPVEPDGAVPPGQAGNAPGGTEPTVRSAKAPAQHDPFRRPSDDPTLGDGAKPPTSEAWGATQGLPDDAATAGSALVVGEALVDIVERPGEEPAEHPGGSPANVAVGLARLGRDVELVSWFGADPHGSLLRSHLELENVRLSAASARAGRTSTARARLDDAGGATYDFDLEWAPPTPEPTSQPRILHTGSIAAVLEPGAQTVTAAVEKYRGSATISYDPNVRPPLMGEAEQTRGVVEGLVARADVVKVSDEDLAWLVPGAEPLDVAREWLRTGPALVVVTRGAQGAWAAAADGTELTAAAREVEVVDTVGAGDSFMAGILDGLWSAGLLGADRRQALREIDAGTLQGVLDRASTIAAITVSREGANPPTRAELTTD